MPVSSDEEAIKLMNDSPYGLTASVWTDAANNSESESAFLRIVDEVATGTVFLNRYVDVGCVLCFMFFTPLSSPSSFLHATLISYFLLLCVIDATTSTRRSHGQA